MDMSIVDISLENIDDEIFDLILREVTKMIVNKHFKKHFTVDDVYKYICFRDNNDRNLAVDNLILLEN